MSRLLDVIAFIHHKAECGEIYSSYSSISISSSSWQTERNWNPKISLFKRK